MTEPIEIRGTTTIEWAVEGEVLISTGEMRMGDFTARLGSRSSGPTPTARSSRPTSTAPADARSSTTGRSSPTARFVHGGVGAS